MPRQAIFYIGYRYVGPFLCQDVQKLHLKRKGVKDGDSRWAMITCGRYDKDDCRKYSLESDGRKMGVRSRVAENSLDGKPINSCTVFRSEGDGWVWMNPKAFNGRKVRVFLLVSRNNCQIISQKSFSSSLVGKRTGEAISLPREDHNQEEIQTKSSFKKTK